MFSLSVRCGSEIEVQFNRKACFFIIKLSKSKFCLSQVMKPAKLMTKILIYLLLRAACDSLSLF